MMYKNFSRIFAPFLFILMLYLYLPVGAQDRVTYYDPISEISLNIKELTMQVGDQINLPVTYIPAETPNVFLNWYTDEKTIRIDPETLTVTALSAGKTRLLVESSFGFAWDYCDITVIGSGSKSVSEKKAGTELISLSEADRSKIKAETFLRYLDFISNSSFIPENFNELSE